MEMEEKKKDKEIVVPNPGRFPRRVTLELTNRCNLNCTFCPRRLMEKHQGFLDLDLAKELIREMADHLPVTLVPFFRGEPLLHPDWKEILSYAKRKGIGPIQFTTNATLMDREAAATILDLELDFISFSMDTIDPELYMQTRRGANYESILKNLSFLLELKERRGLKLPEVQISAVDTPLYRRGMDAFVEFWRPKVDRVRIYVEHSQDGHPGSIASPLPVFDTRMPCHKVFGDMIVYWDGEAAICNHDWNRDDDHCIGNVKGEGIANVWQSRRYRIIRGAHRKGKVRSLAPCDFCDHWKMYYLPEGYLGEIHSRANTDGV